MSKYQVLFKTDVDLLNLDNSSMYETTTGYLEATEFGFDDSCNGCVDGNGNYTHAYFKVEKFDVDGDAGDYHPMAVLNWQYMKLHMSDQLSGHQDDLPDDVESRVLQIVGMLNEIGELFTGHYKNCSVKNYGVKGVQKIGLATPEGWEVTPTEIEVNFESKYEEQIVAFTVVSPKKNSKGEVSITVNGKPSKRIEEIMYDHIPAQLVFLPAKATLLNLVIDIEEGKVGYVEGAGDQVGLAIEQMGYEVVYLSKEDLSTQDLNQYQAIITGIRAYNVHPWLMDFHSRFMDYVRQGGNFIIQYNTRSRSYNTDKMGPYPFKISRDRVSEEDAIVSFIDPKHGLLNEPNKIRTEDFDGWVQERGLYFANEWDNKYETLFSWNDKGESPKMGALIYAPYGEGSFVYTGISFFRELPAGVPGAFKLLANLISHESDE